MDVHNPFRDLALQCPAFTPDEASLIARELFGVEGPVTELGSNQDRNYRVDAARRSLGPEDRQSRMGPGGPGGPERGDDPPG